MMRAVPSTIATKLKAAARPIAEQGLEHTKMEEIADAAGIPKATLYYYFTGKEEILGFLFRDLLAEIADSVAVACDAPTKARQRLVDVVTIQLRGIADHPEICRALIADLGRADRIPDISKALADAFYSPVARLLKDGAEDESLRPVEDPAATSMAIFGAVTITGLHYLVAGEPLEPEGVARQVLAVLLDGLRRRRRG